MLNREDKVGYLELDSLVIKEDKKVVKVKSGGMDINLPDMLPRRIYSTDFKGGRYYYYTADNRTLEIYKAE